MGEMGREGVWTVVSVSVGEADFLECHVVEETVVGAGAYLI